MRRRSWWSRIPIIGDRPVVAAVAISALTITLLGGAAVVLARGGLGHSASAGQTATRPSSSARFTPFPYPSVASSYPFTNPASCCPPNGYPASAGYPPYGGPASGPFPPQSNPASPSGQYPPFYPPASFHGSDTSTMALSCRVPVYAGGPGSGGFIVFPGGSFIADPTSNVALPAGSNQQSGYGPGGPGFAGMTYDRAYSRWIPVPVNWVSPDGKHYAYVTDDLYGVAVSSGSTTKLHDGSTWMIDGVQNDGVYAGDRNAGGLWFFPFSGSARQITSGGYWQAASSVAAYGTATSAVPQGVTNTIIRLDLRTGSTTEWFSHQDTQSSVLGFDAQGDPILHVQYNSGNEIWIVPSPNHGTAIAGFSQAPYSSSGFQSWSTPVADGHGIWFSGNWSAPYNSGSASGLALYVPGSGMYWMSSLSTQLAGGCS